MKFKKDPCLIANATSTKRMGSTAQILTTHIVTSLIQSVESILSTRLSDENYRGLLNFAKITIPGIPMEDIRKALVSQKKDCK